MTPVQGNCLCGAVRFTLRVPLRGVVNCHCSQCRRSHGHYAAYTAAARDGVEFEAAADLRWYRSSERARRGFCARCGSSLFWDLIGDGQLRIAAGALQPPTGLRTLRHIHVEHKGDYYDLDDDLDKLSHGLLSDERS